MDQVIPGIPESKILLETDSPYLAPAPNRGKRNEPSFLPIIAQRIANLREVPVESVALATTQNALTLFSPDGV